MCGLGPKQCPNFPGWPLGGCTNPWGCAGQDGGVISLSPCNASDPLQVWRWNPVDALHGGFVLPGSANGDLSLGCVMDNVNNCGPGDALHLWEFDETPNQLWNASRRPTEGGAPGTLQAQLLGTCVTANGTALTMERCATDRSSTTATAQQFSLLPSGQIQSAHDNHMCVTGSGSTPGSSGNTTPGTVVSAYRIFDSDPIVWESNFTMRWRNGEVSPPGFPGMKCVEGDPGFPNGTIIGSPKPSLINSYVWLYEW
jgi:hypothetical protein